jgi:hypothetical protein
MEGPRSSDRVVPTYAFTRGRTRPIGQELPLEAIMVATQRPPGPGAPAFSKEERAIIESCATPTAVAEIGALLSVPVGVARVLVGDLAADGHLELHLPDQGGRDQRPAAKVLERLLDGLRAR